MSDSERNESEAPATWKPIGRHQRRVLGVLVEKAKTTPDNYPLTLAALVAGCNQKSNRSPQMQLDEDDVADALTSLRACGAVREVQGSGRVNKYRHAAYEWLDVNSPQAAVMTELLLRGPQTAGELRSRASRMEPFADLDVLGATLDELQAKGLVIPLTPPGRGQVFAHALYEPDEMRKVRAEAGTLETTAASPPRAPENRPPASAAQEPREQAESLPERLSGGTTSPQSPVSSERFAALEDEIRQLRARVARLEQEFGIPPETVEP